ncbi:M18 family aminopeptidase [Flavonifractor sp. An92]|uniref:M18 family aminopeptidase n=1 Tax=Flavonifractor sp. An92 TaxID=1965666 RepID=UPI000B36E258|nr:MULTISPECIES: M18 family aminopeptidase [unclassified Flavonifractor]OUN05638.1 M18 family aminopeptidase [Flavonifractor sp. An92]OUQ22643.1 M18 family aminopeptidase [Flavonifractor sp. An135]
MSEINQELLSFIRRSPSCYHAVANLAAELTAHGFTELSEGAEWKLEKGGRYFIRRNLSSILAFRVPEGELKGVQIAASHSDSPTFKLKENMDVVRDGAYTELNVEKYGGMLCAPWFDRPLSVAGKVVVRQDGRMESRLVDLDRDLLMIPNLAIHMNRSVNDGYQYSIQKDMLPLLGDETAKGGLMPLVAQAAGVAEEDILGHDLFLYCRSEGTVWGLNGEYLSSPKLDDLQCTFANLKGFLAGGHPNALSVYAVFDNEEVGSSTKQGAASTVLLDTLTRINECLGRSRQDYLRMLANGFMVSADNAHAAHPNHLDKADLTNHPHMNQGIVIKFSANQKYCTDSVSAALFREICRRADAPTQVFHNHSDILGGSTLGNLSNAQVSLNMVDIGLPQLAMHSPYETAGTRDTEYLVRAMTVFFRSLVQDEGQGSYSIHSVTD